MIDLASLPVDLVGVCDRDLKLELAELTPHPIFGMPVYHFRMVQAATGEELGRIRLRVASGRHVEMFHGHIGYRVHPEHRGHRYAARSLGLLLPLAGRLGLVPLWITCNPENAASRRTLELAGAEFVEEVETPPDCALYRDGHRTKCRYRLAVGPGDRVNRLSCGDAC